MFLFNWIRSLFSSAPKEENYALYKPEERLLYSFFDGKTVQCVDPLMLYRKMMDVGPDLHAACAVAESPSKDAPQAQKDAVRYIRTIFDVKAYEEGGLTEIETIGLMEHFWTYCGRIKKNSRKSPTSSAASEDSPPSPEEVQPTTNSSDSGSTASEQPTEPPTPSTSEPASLSDQTQAGNSGMQSVMESEKPSSTNPSSKVPESDR